MACRRPRSVSSSSSLRTRAEAARDQECRDHRDAEHDSQHQAIKKAGRSEYDGGRAQQRVTDHAAKSGRQRPCAVMRPATGKACCDHRAQDPAAQPQCFAIEGAMGQHAPAPHRDRQDQHDGAEAQNLHQEIRADGAGIADDVADRTRRGMAEARILHRPGHHRRADHARQRDQAEACAFAQPPRQRLAHRGRQLADQGNDTFDRWHAHRPAINPELRPADATPRP